MTRWPHLKGSKFQGRCKNFNLHRWYPFSQHPLFATLPPFRNTFSTNENFASGPLFATLQKLRSQFFKIVRKIGSRPRDFARIKGNMAARIGHLNLLVWNKVYGPSTSFLIWSKLWSILKFLSSKIWRQLFWSRGWSNIQTFGIRYF